MSEIQALDAEIAAPAPDDDLAAPPQTVWQRFESAILGAGSIAALLVAWEVLPHLVTLSAGTKLFFTTPSQIAGTLWTMFAAGTIWRPFHR